MCNIEHVYIVALPVLIALDPGFDPWTFFQLVVVQPLAAPDSIAVRTKAERQATQCKHWHTERARTQPHETQGPRTTVHDLSANPVRRSSLLLILFLGFEVLRGQTTQRGQLPTVMPRCHTPPPLNFPDRVGAYAGRQHRQRCTLALFFNRWVLLLRCASVAARASFRLLMAFVTSCAQASTHIPL